MRIRKHNKKKVQSSKKWTDIIHNLKNTASTRPLWKYTNTLLALILFVSANIFILSQYLPSSMPMMIKKIDEKKNLDPTHYYTPYPLPSLDEMIEILDKMNNENVFKFYDSHIPQNTNDYDMDNVKVINQINAINQNFKHCVPITSNTELPIGIPQIEQQESINASQPPLFCIMYTPGFSSGYSLFNELEYWSFRDNFLKNRKDTVIPKQCLKNKTTETIADSMYFTTANNERGLNMAILISGDACDVFQHFAAWIPARYAVIHEWLMQISQNRQNEKIQHLNITIATNWNNETDQIQNWFWSAMGFEHATNILNDYVTVNLLYADGWRAKMKHEYYSPLFVAPFIFNTDQYSTGSLMVTLTPMYSWNTMHSIKPYLTDIGIKRDCIIYLDRGKIGYRAVRNNEEVKEYLQRFADDFGYELIVKGRWNGHEEHLNDCDDAKKLFSRAMITIGPHGGAFANMIFMQSDSFIVEFDGWQNEDHRAFFYALSQANGLHYYYLAPNNFSYSEAMDVNMTHLDDVMNRIVKRI